MSANDAPSTIVARNLIQRAMCELALRQVELQLKGQGLTRNGPFWREVQREIQRKAGELDSSIGENAPSGYFCWKDLFKVMML